MAVRFKDPGNTQQIGKAVSGFLAGITVSFMCWIRNRTVPTGNQFYIAVNSATSTDFGIGLVNGTNQLTLFPGGGNPSPTYLAPGVWNHLCATNDGTGSDLWVNGQLSRVAASAGSDTVNAINIGFDGKTEVVGDYDIAEFRFWERARLTQGEILKEMWSPRPVRTRQLFAWLPLYNVQTQTLDYSGHNNNFTQSGPQLTNSPHPFQTFRSHSLLVDTTGPRSVFDLARTRVGHPSTTTPVTTVVFRKSLSPIGGKVGTRQMIRWR